MQNKILIIDDSDSVRESMHFLFESSGHDCLTAQDGFNGVLTFLDHKDHVAIIFCDYEMPIFSGGQFTQIINKMDTSLTLVGMSANPVYQEAFINYGASDFLLKPNDITESIKIVEKTIQ